MEFSRSYSKFRHLFLTHLDADFIVVCIQCRPNDQPRRRCRFGDQVNDRGSAQQWSTAPVLRDVAEQPVLDLVPFARPWWKMTHPQLQVDPVSQVLQRHLPQPRPVAIAAATIGGDQQFAGMRKALTAHVFPPTLDRACSKVSRVVVNADAHPPLVVGHVVDAVRDGLAQRRVFKVMNTNVLRLALRLPFLAGVLEITQQFLLFRVHRHDRLSPLLQATDLGIDVFKLRIAVRMRTPFPGLAIGLQTVAHLDQQSRYRAITDRVMLPRQLLCQPPRALTRPAQGRLGISTSKRVDEGIQRTEQTRIDVPQAFPAATRSPDARLPDCCWRLTLQLTNARGKRGARQSRGSGNGGDSAPSKFDRFRRGPLAARTFIEHRSQCPKLSPNLFDYPYVLHTAVITRIDSCVKTQLASLFFRGALAAAKSKEEFDEVRYLDYTAERKLLVVPEENV